MPNWELSSYGSHAASCKEWRNQRELSSILPEVSKVDAWSLSRYRKRPPIGGLFATIDKTLMRSAKVRGSCGDAPGSRDPQIPTAS